MPSLSTVTTDWELSSIDAEDDYNGKEKLQQNRLRWALRRQRTQQQKYFNGEHDSDTGMESMSSTEIQHIITNTKTKLAHKNNNVFDVTNNNTKIILPLSYSKLNLQNINITKSDSELNNSNKTITTEQSPVSIQQSISTQCSSLSSHHTGSCSFCFLNENDDKNNCDKNINTSSLSHQNSNDCKRLSKLIFDVERLKNEKTDLLQQNVTCKTDIKKLKERLFFILIKKINLIYFLRQSILTIELDRANDEIQRLRKLLKQPFDGGSDLSNCSTGSLHYFEFDSNESPRQNEFDIENSVYSLKNYNFNETYHVFSSSN